jgi:U1 small nuclear ribonucleoprotein
VGRLSYETTEKKLRRDFEQFGVIKSIRLVVNNETEKSRGYAFIEFENEQDMTTAVRKSEGRKIDGKRILIDVERGRCVIDCCNLSFMLRLML